MMNLPPKIQINSLQQEHLLIRQQKSPYTRITANDRDNSASLTRVLVASSSQKELKKPRKLA